MNCRFNPVFTVYFEKTQELENEDLPLHWRYDTRKRSKAILKYFHTSSLPAGKATTFRIWLPEFDVNSPPFLNTFFQINTKVNKRTAPKLPLYIHKIKLVLASDYADMKLVQEGEIHSSTSAIDSQWTQNLLLLTVAFQ